MLDFVDECCQCGHNCGIAVFLDIGDKYGECDDNYNPVTVMSIVKFVTIILNRDCT